MRGHERSDEIDDRPNARGPRDLRMRNEPKIAAREPEAGDANEVGLGIGQEARYGRDAESGYDGRDQRDGIGGAEDDLRTRVSTSKPLEIGHATRPVVEKEL